MKKTRYHSRKKYYMQSVFSQQLISFCITVGVAARNYFQLQFTAAVAARNYFPIPVTAAVAVRKDRE